MNRKLLQAIEHPKSVGAFSKADAKAKGMRLAVGSEEEREKGCVLFLYLLVDESDAVIADAKFQVFGPPVLIGAVEIACSLLLRKNYDQASRLTLDLLDKEVQAEDASFYLTLVLACIHEAAKQCLDIPLASSYVAPPLPAEPRDETQEYPGWKELSTPQQIAVVEEVIAREIRPYIELDAGGVQIVDLIAGRELVIAYEGACTSCHSATGATLGAIQDILRTKVHPEISVTPKF
jgi:NifU-like protein